MNEFVEECRREWRRLGVPDPVANEMAADLGTDLAEAEAEGVPAEEVLGSGAFDPRSFAAAWAAERGVVGQPLPSERGLTRRSRLVAALGTLALITATVGAVLVLVASPSPERLSFAPSGETALATVWTPPATPPPQALRTTVNGRIVLLPVPAPPDARVVAVVADASGVDDRTIGSVLLIVGLAGLVPCVLFALWLGPGRGRAAGRSTTTV